MYKPSLSHEADPRFHVRIAGVSDVGRVREKNEDAWVAFDLDQRRVVFDRTEVGPRGLLLAVADGMGGADAGDVASAMVVEHLTDAITGCSDGPDVTCMHDAVKLAHEAVWDHANARRQRMGATLTALHVRRGEATIAQVGDSRAYLLRNGELSRLTHDQSMVQLMVDQGIMTDEQAVECPFRNVILQAMGHQPKVAVALSKLALRDRDALLLCSDGLTGDVSDAEIRDVLTSSLNLEVAAKRLVDLANERGGHDNTTVVLAGVGGELPAAKQGESTLEVLTKFEGRLRH